MSDKDSWFSLQIYPMYHTEFAKIIKMKRNVNLKFNIDYIIKTSFKSRPTNKNILI